MKENWQICSKCIIAFPFVGEKDTNLLVYSCAFNLNVLFIHIVLPNTLKPCLGVCYCVH